MKKNLLKLALAALAVLTATGANAADTKTPAFPGAEGYGRYTTGGRGGKVYHVTNLNDSGSGSLRWALSQAGPRTIVFDVDGTIHLNSALNIPSNTTIAGQTAPGEGICVADYPFAIRGSNVIVRYIRARLGNKNVLVNGADGWDGFGGFDQRDIIIDHCSVSWSIDECLSVLGNVNTTVQWCIVAQSLVNSGHSKGAHGYGGNWGGSGASFHHNLVAHHGSRTPRLGPRPTTQLDERVDMRNNVIYNFGGNGCYGGEGQKVNIVNNYYKPGPGSPTNYKGMRIAAVGVRTNEYVATYPAYADALHLWGKYYVTGNVNASFSQVAADNWANGMYNQIDAGGCDGTYTRATRDSIKIDTPIPFVHTTTHTAQNAYTMVRTYAGACAGKMTNYKKAKTFDAFDTQILSDVANGTATATGSGLSKGFVNSQDDNTALVSKFGSAWPTLASGTALPDTDGDGMPDAWETLKGLNPNDASDGNAKTLSTEGYTNVEVYMNSLVEDNITSKLSLLSGTVEGQEEVPASKYDTPSSGGGGNDDGGQGGGTTGYSISPATHVDGWTFNDVTVSISGKDYAEGHVASDFTGIKFSRNTNYTVNLPEGVTIASVTVKGYSNGDGVAFVQTLGDNTFTADDHTFASKETSEHTYALANMAKGTMVFRPSGDNQIVATLEMIAADPTGIKEMLAPIRHDGRIYNLQGVEVKNLRKGIYIRNGRKVIISE